MRLGSKLGFIWNLALQQAMNARMGVGLIGVSVALLIGSIWVPERVTQSWNNAYLVLMSSGLALINPEANRRPGSGTKQAELEPEED